MSEEINLISEIREAERIAEEMIAEARAKGEAMIEKIRDEFREKTILAEKEFQSGKLKSAESAKADAETETIHIYEENEKETSGIKDAASSKVKDAADFLIRKILE